MSLSKLKQYVETEVKDETNSHGYRAASSFSMLEHVDLMLGRYLSEKQTDQGAILLDVFGILQGLFVAIDALYDLAIGLTQFKYHVNINQNPTLHELKYIRNDIVGHPTHRTYPDGGMGFSILETKGLSKEKLSYQTYIYEKNSLEIKTKDVLFAPLIEAYKKERDIVLNDIYQYLQHAETKTSIPEQVYMLYETLNMEILEQVKKAFMKEYNLDQSSSHRFLWRASLVDTLIHWEEQDSELKEFILYMSRYQVSKMYDIALDMEKRTGKDLYPTIPSLLGYFYKFIRKNEKVALPLLDNLHDYNHPLNKKDILALMTLNPNKEAFKLLAFLRNVKDETKVYLIGSMLRAYRARS
jgi:hypothetical protein